MALTCPTVPWVMPAGALCSWQVLSSLTGLHGEGSDKNQDHRPGQAKPISTGRQLTWGRDPWLMSFAKDRGAGSMVPSCCIMWTTLVITDLQCIHNMALVLWSPAGEQQHQIPSLKRAQPQLPGVTSPRLEQPGRFEDKGDRQHTQNSRGTPAFRKNSFGILHIPEEKTKPRRGVRNFHYQLEKHGKILFLWQAWWDRMWPDSLRLHIL